MKKRTALLVMALFGVALCAPATEFPLQLKKISGSEAMELPGGYGAGSPLNVTKPDEVKKEPQAASKHPLYGQLGLGGKAVAFRLDESQGTGKGYDQVIIDLNGNGDLADDPVGKPAQGGGQVAGAPEQTTFGPIDVASGRKGVWEPTLYAQAMIYNRRAITSSGREYIGYLRVKSGTYLETTVEVEGMKQKIGIADANCNARLGDESKLAIAKSRDQEYWNLEWGDAVLRDHDGSGKFESDTFSTEADYFSPVIFFRSNPYTLTLSEDLSAARIEPYAGPTGELVVSNSDCIKSLVVGWEKAPGAWAALGLHQGGGKVKVPAGTYGVYSCVVAGQDESAATISGGAYNRSPSKTVKIEAGQSAALACGPPLEVRVQATKRASQSSGGILGALSGSVSTPSQIDINVEVAGAGGEMYAMSSFMKTDKRGSMTQPEPPRFKILDESGKEIAAGQLEYG